MLDVKKLITGFLILALGASASAWILSDTGRTMVNTPRTTGESTATMNNNAFVASANIAPDDIVNLPSLSSSTAATLDQPDNLTGILSNSLLDNLTAENPDGVQTDASGNEEINTPDNQAILAKLKQNVTLSGLNIPNWDLEAAGIPIHITKATSPTNAIAYSNAVTKIFNDSFAQGDVQNMVSDTSGTDPTSAGYVKSSVEGALANASLLEAPSNLGNFQKSLIKLLVYEKNTLSLAENANADPVKTSIIFQNEQLKYNLALNEFKDQLKKAQDVNGFSLGNASSKTALKNTGLTAFIDNVLGIKTAYAIFGIGDITFDPTIFAQTLLEYANNIILQILKNTIISFIQNKVLKWVAGSGAPRFIQNWGSEMVNAAQNSAITAINSNYACVNPNTVFPRIQVILNALYKQGNNVCASQFQSNLSSGNLKQFYNNFANGGFVTFGQTLLPSNDFYGGLFFTAQTVGQAAQQGQSVFSLKTTANQGWKGSVSCSDDSDPNGTSEVCDDNSTPTEKPTCPIGWTPKGDQCINPAGITVAATTQLSCADDSIPVQRANDGECANGSDPTVTSPGQVTGQVFNSAVDSGGKLTTAANDIAGLLDAALSSLLNGLASMAVTAGSGAANGAMNGGGSVTSLAASAPTQTSPDTSSLPAQSGVQCAPQTQTLTLGGGATATFYPQGGATSVSGGSGSPTYTWSAPGAVSTGNTVTAVGGSFTATYNATGTFTVFVTASTDNSNSSCTVILQ